ncbi:hypothetical protein BLNAU_7101 [Blattamonas nauphoetae]|uniref:Uncharacterized protein n=1 Tax=Blattamonas nauphoetae TaxID=2049346 RepID=A0ABQ9Y2G2_9EUKA|nr:hypothetical protein BLNAU_7101 [Blattamonas nauphoetae]
MRPKIGTQPTESEDEPTQPETEEKSTLQAIPASKPKFDENFLSSSEYRLPCNALDMVELELTRQAYFVPEVDASFFQPQTPSHHALLSSPSLSGHPLSTSPPSAPQMNQHKHELPQRVLARLQTLPPISTPIPMEAMAQWSMFMFSSSSLQMKVMKGFVDLEDYSVTQRDSNCFAQSSIYPRFSTNHLTTISSFTTTLTPNLTPTTSLPTAPLSPSPTPSRPPDAAPPQVTSLDTQIAQIPQSYSLHSSSQPTQQGRVSLTLEELEANLRQKPAGSSGMDGYGGRSQ